MKGFKCCHIPGVLLQEEVIKTILLTIGGGSKYSENLLCIIMLALLLKANNIVEFHASHL